MNNSVSFPPSSASDPDDALLRQLSPELQEACKRYDHLAQYIRELPIDEIGVPEYYGIRKVEDRDVGDRAEMGETDLAVHRPTNISDYYSSLSGSMRNVDYRNLIYPVPIGVQGVFVHMYPDRADSRDICLPIEPGMHVDLSGLMDQVNKRLEDYEDELNDAGDYFERDRILLQTLDRICFIDKRSRGPKATIQVTEKELQALIYLILRDKGGLGRLEHLINDLFIEDISCSGVGPVFVEHKIFGSLKAIVSFYTHEELDTFVVGLSKKTGCLVTVQEPIADGVLPNGGSLINIVYGSDISRRGSNFTIRKVPDTPKSVLDLIDAGALSYETAAYISLMLREGMNTFVCGPAPCGKTTMLNAITTFIRPNARIVSIEDVPGFQVPHLNWAREVTRRGSTGVPAVTKSELLDNALRQRPDAIITDEIWGREGQMPLPGYEGGPPVHVHLSRCFSGTAHPVPYQRSCKSTQGLYRQHGPCHHHERGAPARWRRARRVLSINEIVSFDLEANSLDSIEVFRWDPSTDTFEFPGKMKSKLLEAVAERRGFTPETTPTIYDEIVRRADILRRLREQNLTDFYELHGALAQAYREGVISNGS